MNDDNQTGAQQKCCLLVHSLFSAWMLAFLFEGQIFYALAEAHRIDPAVMVFCGVAAVFAGLLLCGLFLLSYLFLLADSVFFFFPSSVFRTFGVLAGSFPAGGGRLGVFSLQGGVWAG